MIYFLRIISETIDSIDPIDQIASVVVVTITNAKESGNFRI